MSEVISAFNFFSFAERILFSNIFAFYVRFARIRACVRIVSFCEIFQASNFIFVDFLLS